MPNRYLRFTREEWADLRAATPLTIRERDLALLRGMNDRIDLTEHEREFSKGYERVNDLFAETASKLIEPDDLVWIHDYHFIPLGERLRSCGVSNRLGFFLHIPWPPTRLLVVLPYHERLVRSLLHYDLIGFQCTEWLESFLHYCRKELGAEVDEKNG